MSRTLLGACILASVCVGLLAGCASGSSGSAASNAATDPLTALASSTQNNGASRVACASALKTMGPLPSTVTLTATAEATFSGVKAAMVTRIGQKRADVAAPLLSDDATVDLCALDTSRYPATPPVSHVVLAVSGTDTWWADGALS